MILGVRIEWLGVREPQRPERRGPEERKTRGIPEIVEQKALREHVAAVDEPGEAQRRILSRARHREEQLEVAGRLAVSAQGSAKFILRPERERAVAAHRARPPREVVLEERQRLAF